jgi:hypothetical protein
MLDRLIDALRPEVSGERALASVRTLARFHRVQASPGLDRAADWLAGELERAGLRVGIERVPGDGRTRFLGHLMPQGWDCARGLATLHGDGPARVISDVSTQPLSIILRSVAARGRYPIVALDDGTEAVHYEGIEVRGRVVLTRGDVHRVHELAVVARGAAGLLSFGRRLLPPVRGEHTDPDAIAYTSFWWSEREPRGWGFAISPAEAERLRERLAAGTPLELEVEIDSRAFDTTIPLVSGSLPAADPAAREVLIVSHLCHPQPSANDNASGVAANLEAARALAALRRSGALPATRHTIRHLWMPEFTGTFAWLSPRADSAPQALVAALNLDMVGEDQQQCGSTFLLEHPPCFSASFAETLIGEIRRRSADWVLSYAGPGHVPVPRMGEVPFSGGSDHAVFLDPGFNVPCPMLIQWPDRYYHSSLDTPDRCDPASLALAARCAAAYAGFLAAAGPPELGELSTRIGRGARRRLLQALDHDDAPRQVRAEHLRARCAFESLTRLGGSGNREEEGRAIGRAIDSLEDFLRREITPNRPAPPATSGAGHPRDGIPVPVRSLVAPLHYQRWLIEGWERLPSGERERWRAAEAGSASLGGLFDLAWSRCDGRRDLSSIAELVWLETGRLEEGPIQEFFGWTEALGLSGWRSGTGGD